MTNRSKRYRALIKDAGIDLKQAQAAADKKSGKA